MVEGSVGNSGTVSGIEDYEVRSCCSICWPRKEMFLAGRFVPRDVRIDRSAVRNGKAIVAQGTLTTFAEVVLVVVGFG